MYAVSLSYFMHSPKQAVTGKFQLGEKSKLILAVTFISRNTMMPAYMPSLHDGRDSSIYDRYTAR